MDTTTNDFLTFKRMLTPLFIQALFWVGVFLCMIAALPTMIGISFWRGLLILIIGPILIRLWCELIVVIFSINDSLTDIRNKLVTPSAEPPLP